MGGGGGVCVRAYVIQGGGRRSSPPKDAVGVKRRDLIAGCVGAIACGDRISGRIDKRLAELDEKARVLERHQHVAQAADGRNLGWRAGGQVAFQRVQGDGRDPPGGGGGGLGEEEDDGARPLRKVRGSRTLRVVHERRAWRRARRRRISTTCMVVPLAALSSSLMLEAAERRGNHRRRLLVGLELRAHIGHARAREARDGSEKAMGLGRSP